MSYTRTVLSTDRGTIRIEYQMWLCGTANAAAGKILVPLNTGASSFAFSEIWKSLRMEFQKNDG